MDTNQVGSINFDANNLYLEEESEHELDDKQQDNEIKELISQGGLDGILDDESLISSSGESSYDEDDQTESNQRSQQQIINKNETISNNIKPNSPLVGVDIESYAINHEIRNDEQINGLFSPKHNMNPPLSIPSNNNNNNNNNNIIATPMLQHQMNQNYALNDYRNQYSTPSANQIPPLPSAQMLQATVIPNISEENLFYQRQRQQLTANQPNQLNEVNGNSSSSSSSSVAVATQPKQQQQDVNDTNPLNYTNQYEIMNPSNYMQIQKQHYMPHSKMHSLDRFGVQNNNSNSLMPNPVPQRLITAELKHDPHEHLTNDHELSLNETDNEEDDDYHHNQNNKLHNRKTEKLDNPNVTPLVNPKYAFNNGIQLEFNNTETNNNLDKKYEETSVIDLNELDEEQLEQLKVEEDKQQKEYFSIDNLNRQYCQTLFLYKVRGKKLEETKNLLASYQEDTAKEIRAMKHRLSMAEQEKQSIQTSLDQVHDLCNQYKSETDLNKKTALDLQDKCEKLKHTNRMLEQKLAENEEIIDNLQIQIGEQQKLDTLERVQEQHEHFIQQMRDQYEKDIFQLKEKIAESQSDLKEKQNIIHMLRIQLETSTNNAELASVERADTINRLTKNLTDLQIKYDQDILLSNLSSGKKLNIHNDTNYAKLEEYKQEIQRLTNLADEYEREKMDLHNDLMEKNSKLDQLMEQEEQFQQMKNSLELDIYSKQQHILECEKVIEQMHHSNNQEINNQQNQQIINEYEAQLGELKLRLTNREHEIQKIREMYIDVCNDKNNLQDSMKLQYDTDYELKLKQRVQSTLNDKLEEQKNFLWEKWQTERTSLQDEYRRQCDSYLTELKQTKEQLVSIEKQFDQVRLEKVNVELKANRAESELKDKVLMLEKTASEMNSESEAKTKNESVLKNEINLLKSELTNCKQENTALNEILQNLNIQYQSLLKEKSDLMQTIETLITERDNYKSESLKLIDLKETESNKLKDLELKLKNSDSDINDLKMKLETSRQILIKSKNDQIEKNDRDMRDLEQRLVDEYQNIMNQTQLSAEQKINDLTKLKSKLEVDLTEKQNELNALKQEHDEAKQQWLQEKQDLSTKKEEEFQTQMKQLENRFEEDYSTFMQTHKESIQRTLNEKTQEFSLEKENLIGIYEKKLLDLESNEKQLLQKIRDLKSFSNSPNSLVLNNKQSRLIDAKCQTDYQAENSATTSELEEKVRSLEELIAGTDAHFEQELDKLRQELEDEYQLKIKYEIERSEINQRQLENEIDILRNQLQSKSSSISNSSDNSSIITENNDTADFDLIYTSNKHHYHHNNNNNNKHKYTKLKQELNVKEKEMETVEQAYRIKIDQLQEKYEANLKQMQSKHDTDMNRLRIELNENYKQTLNKSKSEIEQMQLFVQKLKKTNSDSDRVIESLKQEMNRMKETHLDELTSMKLSGEREKENLKEKCEQSQQRVRLVEQRLAESEEHFRKQTDLLRAELKHEYGTELSRMNSKMKDMMKSHANAVELLKKQHQSSKTTTSMTAATASYQNNKTCQTETCVKDIQLLETFRERYLDTVSRMKADMMKHFDAQTQRTSERLQRQLSEERTLVKERLHQVLLPKIIDLLREYRVSEKLIDIKITELEKDLAQITLFSSSSSSTSSTLKKSSDGLDKIKSRTNSPINSLANNYINNLVASPRSSVLKSDSIENLNEVNKKTSASSNVGGSGYKYTPLRQSWSNLSQMNQLSPSYSITSNTSSTNNDGGKKYLSSRREEVYKSPRIHIHQLEQQQQQQRPSTTESLLNNEDKEDYVYFNDQEKEEEELDSNNLIESSTQFKKYRTQNIRQKKLKQTTTPHINEQHQRPQSASSLLLMHSNKQQHSLVNSQFKTSQSNLYSSSATNLNPIGTLYEMSKNYKSIRQVEEDNINNKKPSILISRSSNCIDETPIKLDAEKQGKPTLRSATTVINSSSNNNNGLLNYSRPSSSLSIKTNNSKTGSSISSSSSTTSSRARSRTPTSTCSSLLNDQQQSYRQSTVSSSSKSAAGAVSTNLSSTSSTQYLPINTQSFQKKRTIF